MPETTDETIAARRARWVSRDESALMDYADGCGEPVDFVDVQDLDWVYVDALPVSFLGTRDNWQTFWDRQADFFEPAKLALWNRMLSETIRDPIVIGIHGRAPDGEDCAASWDGLHRTAATVISGRATIPAVVGLERGLRREDLPEALRDVPEILTRLTRKAESRRLGA